MDAVVEAEVCEVLDRIHVIDQSDCLKKRRIVSVLVERVAVSRGYEIHIQFRVGLDVLKEIEDEQ